MTESIARQRRAAALGVIGVAFAAAATLTSANASANPMDFATDRLGVCADGTAPKFTPTGSFPCPKTAASPLGTFLHADNASFAKLATQYGVAIAPPVFAPARTTGYGGFELSLFGTITTIAHDEEYFHRGTEGAISANGNFPSRNDTPDPLLQLYGITGRKGLPYGFELSVSVGYMADTEMATLGGGFRWTVFEGFRKGASQFIPDVSIGAAVNTLVGSSKVKVTAPSFDLQASKPFVIANQLVLQPYIAYQLVWILADSGVVDGTPTNSVLDNCHARPPTPAEQKAGDDGQAHCTGVGKTPADPNARLDVNNDLVFDPVRMHLSRLMLGLAARYEAVHAVLHFATSLSDPSGDGADRVAGMPHQLSFGLLIGMSW